MKLTDTSFLKLVVKVKAQVLKGRGPVKGVLYRMRTEGVDRSLWTREHGWLWTFTGKTQREPNTTLKLPVFRSVATGHEEWLPWDWMEEVEA